MALCLAQCTLVHIHKYPGAMMILGSYTLVVSLTFLSRTCSRNSAMPVMALETRVCGSNLVQIRPLLGNRNGGPSKKYLQSNFDIHGLQYNLQKGRAGPFHFHVYACELTNNSRRLNATIANISQKPLYFEITGSTVLACCRASSARGMTLFLNASAASFNFLCRTIRTYAKSIMKSSSIRSFVIIKMPCTRMPFVI
jgi:hypothetical protein